MKKILLATAISVFACAPAFAQLDQAATKAAEATEHKVEQKKAESEAKKSGPVGAVVNDTKAKYHKAQSNRKKEQAKDALKKAGE